MNIMMDVVTVDDHDVDVVLAEQRKTGERMGFILAKYVAEHVRGFDHLYPQAMSKMGSKMAERRRLRRLSNLPKYFKPKQLELKLKGGE